MIRRKLKSRKGFTLAETLMAMLILLLMSALVAGGIPVAARVYTKAVDAANAQVLLSTTVTELRYTLCGAHDFEVVSEDATVTKTKKIYFSDDTYGKLRIENFSTEDNHGLVLSYITNYNTTNEAVSLSRQLVSSEAATKNLTITYNDVKVEDGKIKFSGLIVTDKNENDLASLDELVITPIK